MMLDKKNNIKVSAYCLTYNHEKYIRDTLEGFVNQITDFEYEVFVHDDASTDQTPEIIREYESKYPNIIKGIYQTENHYSQGKKIVMNYILPQMRGEYVAVCEGDDYWSDPYKLQKQVDFMECNSEYSACVHNTIVWELETNKKTLMNPSLKKYDLEIQHVILEGGSDYHTSSVLYRMEYAKIVHSLKRPDFFDKTKHIKDYPLAIFLALKGKVHYMPDVMSVYRRGVPGSWTKSIASVEHFIEMRKSVIDMLKSVDEYTNYKMHEHINKVIESRYWEILVLSTNIKVLRDKEIKKVFTKLCFEQKFKTLIKLLFLNKYRLKHNKL